MKLLQTLACSHCLGNVGGKKCYGVVGPKLFSACPMDVVKSNVWFTDLWNYFIVSYLAEAVTQLRQVHTTSRIVAFCLACLYVYGLKLYSI